jgi:hypothetical protein
MTKYSASNDESEVKHFKELLIDLEDKKKEKRAK